MNDHARRTVPGFALGFGLVLAGSLTGETAVAAVLASHERAPVAAAAGRAGRVRELSGFAFGRQVLHTELPVIVDFWAPWCIVCRELEAPLAAVAARFGDRARVVRVNVDWHPGLASRYNVRNLPTILVFHHGKVVAAAVGGASEQDLEELLQAQLVAATAAAPAGR